MYSGSPAGLSCAIRAAREGLTVVVVTHTPHLGGMLTSGLRVWDTQWEGRRAPIYDEWRQALADYYRDTYGHHSPQYRAALPGPSGYSNGSFEPRVARVVIEGLVGPPHGGAVAPCPEAVAGPSNSGPDYSATAYDPPCGQRRGARAKRNARRWSRSCCSAASANARRAASSPALVAAWKVSIARTLPARHRRRLPLAGRR